MLKIRKEKSKSTKHIGELEELVMRATLNLDNDAYGVEIRDELLKRIGRELSYGTIYATLERLEYKGFIKARQGETTPERGGKAKRYYSVTGVGYNTLKEAEATRNAFPLVALSGGTTI